MAESERTARNVYDVAIVGASLAGCATAISLGRAGLKVALIEKRPDPEAFKRICSHYIQSSAIEPLERLDLLEPMMRSGAVRSRARIRCPWGWIEPPAKSRVPSGVNLRRERLDPLIRRIAGETPGVDLMLGETVDDLLYDGNAVTGVKARDSHGQAKALRAKLVVGADGRGSQVAKLASLPTKTVAHNRFAYGGYFQGPAPVGSPDASLWLLDPDMAAVFPTDEGLNFYAAMPVKERLADFRSDPAKALVEFVAGIPDAPPIEISRPVGQVQGKIDMTNVAYRPAREGLALVGDAALAVDPLWGVGCGWAFQSAEWLTDGVTGALRGEEPLKKGLARYRRRHARGLKGHAAMIYGYAGGRKLNGGEKTLFSAAVHDEGIAEIFEAFGTRNIGPARMFATSTPKIAVFRAKQALSRRTRRSPSRQSGAEAGSV